MNYLSLYEDMFWKRKKSVESPKPDKVSKLTKDDLYIYKSLSIRGKGMDISVNKPDKSNYIWGEYFSNFDTDLLKTKHNLSSSAKGVFVYQDRYLDYYKFVTDFYNGFTYFDISKYFNTLYGHAKQMGYDVGTQVFIKSKNENGIIKSIRKYAFYKDDNISLSGEKMHVFMTLAFVVDGDKNMYQVTDLDIVDSKEKNMNLGEMYVEDSFLDFMDRDIMSFLSTEFQRGENTVCDIKGSFKVPVTPHLLEEFSQKLMNMQRRLENDNITISIMDISTKEVHFEIYPNK